MHHMTPYDAHVCYHTLVMITSIWALITHNECLGGCRVMQEPELQRDEALSPQVNGLAQGVLLPVPHMQLAAVLSGGL